MNRLQLQGKRIAALISQTINCVFLFGHQDMTVSARCHINKNKPGWKTARKIINKFFKIVLKQEDHCKSSFCEDYYFASDITRIYSESKTICKKR